ncbi:tRNA (adenosine(37)-N6)-dimethylallyltransferase MiaA [Buchnera aphidicola]|uniref:tRNA (adenosine(37)-N6)-dimethylallyltransferase MiaA n=1 Tax=Buchnera aphidicola TaxID=9 RepID=UPI00094C2716|nr:tRNA (adenosine(37)-N6)-dimethylallyltransferase MiaA [Buchnera aphidicola]
MKSKRILFFLMGPTAIGKSLFSMQVKKKFSDIELLSVDSKLIYKELNIGTDKPTPEELFLTPCRLINIKNVQDTYSSADFCNDAYKEIHDIFSIGKIPFFVGGSMLYFKALLDGLVCLPSSNKNVREYIFKILFNSNKKKLFKALKIFDYVSSSKIHMNDIYRVLRALEVFFVSGGIPLSKLLTFRQNKLPYRVFQFAFIPFDKDLLYEKISIRFYKMLENGFEKEVQDLSNRFSFKYPLPFMNSIGYKQMWEYLQKKCTYQDMVSNTLKATHKLVKHQLTWLRKWKNITLIYDNNKNELMAKIEKIINNNK